MKNKVIIFNLFMFMLIFFSTCCIYADDSLVNSDVIYNSSADGWQIDEEGKRFYYIESRFLTGLNTIDNSKYFFDENGVMQTGILSADGAAHYFNTKTGKMRTSTGIFKYKGAIYYTKKGVLQTGWIATNNRAYYFYENGSNKFEAAKDTKVGYLEIPSKGYRGKAYYLGIKRLNKTKWTLKQAYKNSYSLKYANRWMRRDTSEKYAIYGFSNNHGNCYCMAATFYIQAKLLGCNVRQIEGKVNGIWPHSWTQIKQGKKWYVYDPNFRNETGRSGWKIYYGKRGTWKYKSYHVFQN